MKKLKLLLILFLALSLTGCIKKFELTEQQSNATAEYMAGLLLKYDKDYKQSLTPLENLSGTDYETSEDADNTDNEVTPTATPAPTKSAGQQETSGNADNGGAKASKDYTLEEVIGEKNIDIKYTGYKICDTYPEDTTDTYFSLTPREGNQLLITTFAIENLSDKDIKLNLSNSNVVYQLDINVGTIYKPLLTLLENDLQYIDITLGAGKAVKVLLIFEISKEADISDINLIASNGGKSNIIDIK
jgi:hypothetical protein